MAVEAFHEVSADGWYSFKDNHKVNFGTGTITGRVFGDPGVNNLYFGATNDHLASRETFAGHRLGLNRTYWNSSSGSTSSAVSQASTDIAAGRVPWLSFKLQGLTGQGTGVGWAQFASGAGDTWFNGLLASLDAINGGPIMVTLHHEPNGDGPATDYLAMSNHAMSLKGSSYPQILMTPCLSWNYYDITSGAVRYSAWASKTSCDVFGFDSYNHISYVPANGKKLLSVSDMFGLQKAELAALDSTKPWAVGEWGNRTNPSSAGQAATQMLAAYDYARQNGCMGLSWFDSGTNVNDGGSTWVLDNTSDGTDGTERINEFKTILLKTTSVFIPTGGITPP